MNTFISFLIAFLVSFLSMPMFRKLAVKLDILDLPSRRKMHKRATPLLGGVGVYLGLLVGILFNWKDLSFFLPVLVALTILLIVGLVDDTVGLSAQLRLLFQAIAAMIVIKFGGRVTFLPPTLWGYIGEVIVTLIWLIGVTNAYNYLDGLDGLAAGSAVVNAVCFGVILFSTQQTFVVTILAVFIGACLGFLPYNLFRAKIFLGDAGSTCLGFFLASVALVGDWATDSIVKISIPVLILGVPIFDMVFTTIMRIKEEKVKTIVQWLQYGGKDHFHHYLVNLGLTPLAAVIFIYFIHLSLGISAIMVSNDRAHEAILTLSQAAIIFGVIATLIVVGKKHRQA